MRTLLCYINFVVLEERDSINMTFFYTTKNKNEKNVIT